MTNLRQVLHDLQQARDRAHTDVRRLDEAISVLKGLTGSRGPRKRRTHSLAARRKISVAQRARWAKIKRH